jgi:Zn-dependent metalloprotease
MTKRSNEFGIFLAALLICAGTGALSAAQRKTFQLADSMRKVRAVPSAAARAAFRSFTQKQGSGWHIRYSPDTALPEALVGGSTVKYPGTPEQAAAAFFADNGTLLGVDPLTLRLVEEKDFMGITHLEYQQYKDGIPVEFSYARVHVDASGSVVGYQAKFRPAINTNTSPALSEQAAVQAASADLGLPLHVEKSELVIYPDEDSGALELAWKVRGRAAGGLWVYYINASSGAVLLKYDDMRRDCSGYWTTHGSYSGTIYAISPIPADQASDSLYEMFWDAPSTAPLQDQYVWVNNYSSVTVTDGVGDYCAMQDGRVFSSLQGPYFSVTNFRGKSAHWDNDGDAWTFMPASYQSPSPYPNSYAHSQLVTLPAIPSGKVFAKAMPHFTASPQSPFEVGAMDYGGSATDDDELYIRNPAWTTSGDPQGDVAGAYIGQRTVSFDGAAVENPAYLLDLETDASGTHPGFVSSGADVLLFPQGNTNNNATGSVVWAPGNPGVSFMDYATDPVITGANRLSEVNAFYHLNKMHHYFDHINIDPNNNGNPAADLSKRISVMVHANGNADQLGQQCGEACGGMLNGYYDLEHDNIMLGDGPRNPYGDGSYRSFALDGTIIRHEYTHSVVNRIYPIINFGEFGALSEAFADFFSMSSVWKDGVSYNSSTITVLGNFIGAGEASARDLSGARTPGAMTMPDNWDGEVHDDSRILSQALYDLHFNNSNDVSGGNTALGTFTAGPWAGQYKADVLVFAALFYFPDNFSNLYDAMVDACRQIDNKWSGACGQAVAVPKITAAFSAHGIGPYAGGDSYEMSNTSAMCLNNNGQE